MVDVASSASGAVSRAAAQSLSAVVNGEVLCPGDVGYDHARHIWNGMIDRRPSAIIRCQDAGDVAAAVKLARKTGALLSVRGGDHSAAGNAVCEGGVMIDLSPMKAITVDAGAGTVTVAPGVRWAELDAATQAHGLATTGGTVGDTGVAGLALGGGFGWLAGRYGLTCDNLLSAAVVLADGRRVQASADEHPELFWALRGGGGNFGVVTAFTFRLHAVGPIVLAGLIAHPVQRAPDVLAFYRDFVYDGPDDVNTIAGFMTTPDGDKVLAIAMCHCGPSAQAERALAPLRGFGPPVVDQVDLVPYAAFQQALDPLFARGRRYYWKSAMVRELSDEAIAVMAARFASVPSATSMLLLQQIGNAARRVPADATAFAHRNAFWDGLVLSSWDDPAADADQIEWTRSSWAALRPHSTGGVYANGVADGDADEIAGAYGANYARLAAVKAEYDPDNLFRLNANILPARAR